MDSAPHAQTGETSASPGVIQGHVRILRRNDGAEVSAEDMVYPVACKNRGRPKGTGKTLNRVYTKRVIPTPNDRI